MSNSSSLEELLQDSTSCSPVPFLLIQVCAQHSSLEEPLILFFQMSQEFPNAEGQDKLQVPSLWKVTFYTGHRISVEKPERYKPPDKQTISSVPRNYHEYPPKIVCHSRNFCTCKIQFQNLFLASLCPSLLLTDCFFPAFTKTFPRLSCFIGLPDLTGLATLWVRQHLLR